MNHETLEGPLGHSLIGTNIVGIQFRRAGRIFDYIAPEQNLIVGDDVVVDTERGPSLAKVASIRFLSHGQMDGKDWKVILRKATQRDLEEHLKITPEFATDYSRQKAEKLGLKMTILQTEIQFGGNKVIVYFSAPGRVDFRELVKELASGLKARVELKQVGARDEAKLIGGLGICGREYCCSSFLRDFVPVSIKMAKNQNLALNPTKVSGGCGRLLCCLTYENDLYEEFRKNIPPRGTKVRILSMNLDGMVLKGDILNQRILVETSQGTLETVSTDGIEILEKAAFQDQDNDSDTEWGDDLDLSLLASLEEDTKGDQDKRKDKRDHSGPHRKPKRY